MSLSISSPFNYYCYKSTGTMQWDVGEPWWAILTTDKGIVDFYTWLLKKRGVEIQKGSRWGPHISVVKGNEPPVKKYWKHDFGAIEFHYTNQIRKDNGRHVWLDVYSPQLADLRKKLGLDEKPKMTFHLTLGRL